MSTTTLQSLQTQIQSLIDASGAEFGLSIRHLESGQEININAGASFPMASVLKIPVLCAAFRDIERGQFKLTDRWELTVAEKNIGSGILTWFDDGLHPTVRDLLTLMMIISDNTATDMIMHRVGVATIDAFMKELGLANIYMAMDIRGIFDDMMGPENADPRRLFVDLNKQRTAPDTRRDGSAYSPGPDNNASTPRDMTRLLAMMARGEVVSPDACGNMLYIMLQQQLNQRLPRFLPYGVPFAHKTGTLGGIRNNAGILYASADSHVAVTVFCRWDVEAVSGDKVAEDARVQDLDRVFGYIGLALFEHYKDFQPDNQSQPVHLPYVAKA
ncbi:MAG: serine hydrolase [Caldilineaceae bacterium]